MIILFFVYLTLQLLIPEAWAVILLNFLLLFSELCPFRKWMSRVPLNFGSEVANSRDKIGPLC